MQDAIDQVMGQLQGGDAGGSDGDSDGDGSGSNGDGEGGNDGGGSDGSDADQDEDDSGSEPGSPGVILGMEDDEEEDEHGDGDDYESWSASDDDEAVYEQLARAAGLAPAAMHSALRQHDVTLLRPQPVAHVGVRARTYHHQTADALAFVPGAAGGGGSGGAAGDGGAEGVVEDIVVACGPRLALWRLGAAPDGAKLLAEATTCFPSTYSIAVSRDGSLVAACTPTGSLVAIFHLERTPPPPATAAAAHGAAEGGAAHAWEAAAASEGGAKGGAASGSGAGGGKGGGEDAGAGDAGRWGTARLEHYATVQAKSGRESMANCVRFGMFGGKERLLLAHQDGLLYILNLPPPRTPASRAAAAAAAAEAVARGSLAAPRMRALLEEAAAALAARGLPSWPRRRGAGSAAGSNGAREHGRSPGGQEGAPSSDYGNLEDSGSWDDIDNEICLSGSGDDDSERVDGGSSEGEAAGRRPRTLPPEGRADARRRRRAAHAERARREAQAFRPAMARDAKFRVVRAGPLEGQPQPTRQTVHASPQGQTDAIRHLGGHPARPAGPGGPAGAAAAPRPLNTAQPSPDGRWLAVGRDDLRVPLVPAGVGYERGRPRLLSMGLRDPTGDVGMHENGTVGVQYCAFNSASSLLAASCDALRLVAVWGVPSGQLLFRFSDHEAPVLPLRFAGEHILVYAEGTHTTIHVIDLGPARLPDPHFQAKRDELAAVREHRLAPPRGAPRDARDRAPGHGHGAPDGGAHARAAGTPAAWCVEELVDVAEASVADDFEGVGWRVHGLEVTPSGRVLAARQEDMWEFRLMGLHPWSPDTHRHHHPTFRAAARLLLLAAHGGAGGGGGGSEGRGEGQAGGCPLARLPAPVLEGVLRAAAQPLSAWARGETWRDSTLVGGYGGRSWWEMPSGVLHSQDEQPRGMPV